MIIYGLRHFGAVDEVPGVGCVKTRFVHIWFIPLIPLGSTFVTHDDWNNVEGYKVPFSFKSVFVAWSKVALFFAFFGLLYLLFDSAVRLYEIAPVLLKGKHGSGTMNNALQGGGGLCCGGLSLLFDVGFWFLLGRLFGKASESRKAELLRIAGRG